MHNGHFKELRVVDFYVTRDTNPERWYPRADDGSVRKFDDLPVAYQANVNTSEVPYDRTPGEEPRLSPPEIDALVAFLRTLSDGYESPPPQ
jgi:cytochrome c peroxidase